MKLTLLMSSLLICISASAESYDRSQWRHWSDFDSDCQNTRQELLIESSLTAVTFTGANKCTVLSGAWLDVYTGELISMARALDVDHVIPLKYAHDNGGAEWSPLIKKLFANDPENLLAVSAGANRSKGSKGPAGYLPAQSYRCEYVRLWRSLAAKYELSLAIEDKLAIADVQAWCWLVK